MPQIAIIVAMNEERAIGYHNRMLYHLPNDLKHFKRITTGHTVIMGRKTYQSLPKGALPERRNIVLTRQIDFHPAQTETFSSLGEALSACKAEEKIFIIGGANVYAQALPIADELYLTIVHDTEAPADTYFPDLTEEEWQTLTDERHMADDRHPFDYTFRHLVRKV